MNASFNFTGDVEVCNGLIPRAKAEIRELRRLMELNNLFQDIRYVQIGNIGTILIKAIGPLQELVYIDCSGFETSSQIEEVFVGEEEIEEIGAIITNVWLTHFVPKEYEHDIQHHEVIPFYIIEYYIHPNVDELLYKYTYSKPAGYRSDHFINTVLIRFHNYTLRDRLYYKQTIFNSALWSQVFTLPDNSKFQIISDNYNVLFVTAHSTEIAPFSFYNAYNYPYYQGTDTGYDYEDGLYYELTYGTSRYDTNINFSRAYKTYDATSEWLYFNDQIYLCEPIDTIKINEIENGYEIHALFAQYLKRDQDDDIFGEVYVDHYKAFYVVVSAGVMTEFEVCDYNPGFNGVNLECDDTSIPISIWHLMFTTIDIDISYRQLLDGQWFQNSVWFTQPLIKGD